MDICRYIQVVAVGLWLVAGQTAFAQTAAEPSNPPMQKKRIVTLGIGYTDILDTYLSQETFRGSELRYSAQTLRQRQAGMWSNMLSHHLILSATGTRHNRNSLLTAMYNFTAGWYRSIQPLSPTLDIRLGGQADATLGGSYNTRNTNNPAQARASLFASPGAMAAWRFHAGPLPLTLNYELSIPLIGLAFSPNYGQSYYEIFSEGHYDHNIVVVTPFNAPQLWQRLMFDLKLKRTTLSIGYLCDLKQMKANNLKYHRYTHAIFLGWKY